MLLTKVRLVHCHSHNTGGYVWFWEEKYAQKEYDTSQAKSDAEGFDWKIFMHDFEPEALLGGVDVNTLSIDERRDLADAIDEEIEGYDFETQEFLGGDAIIAKNFEGTLIIWEEDLPLHGDGPAG